MIIDVCPGSLTTIVVQLLIYILKNYKCGYIVWLVEYKILDLDCYYLVSSSLKLAPINIINVKVIYV
jgi:hypothetical protein